MSLDFKQAASTMIDLGASDDDIRATIGALKQEALSLMDKGASDAEIERAISQSLWKTPSGKNAPLFQPSPSQSILDKVTELEKRTQKVMAVPRPQEGFVETLKHEFNAGIDEIARADAQVRKAKLTPAQIAGSSFDGPAGDAIAGALRSAGSPFTATGRAVGQKLQDLTLPYLGDIGSSALATAADLGINLVSPNTVAKVGSLASQGIKALPKFGRAKKIAELSTPIKVPPTPDQLMAEAATAPATDATREAMLRVLADRNAPPIVPPELRMAEAATASATDATRRAALADLAAKQQAEQLANKAASAIPRLPQAQQAAEILSPVSKSVVDAGKFGVESFKKQKALAEAPFKAFYENIEKAYPGKVFEPKNALAVKAKISGMVEPIEKGLAKQSERIAGQPIGTMGQTSPTFVAMSEDEMVGYIQKQIKDGNFDIVNMTPEQRASLLRKTVGGDTVTNAMSMQDMILARRRMGAAARHASSMGDNVAAAEFQAMKNAYFQDIAAVNPKLAERLKAVDRKYAEEFIPKYGFDSIAGKAVENAGMGEGLIPSIFKPFTRKTKDDLFTVKAAKDAYTPEQFGVIGRSFVEDLIHRSMVEGEFDPRKFRQTISQYRPETLIEGLGSHGYANLKQFADEFDAARQLQRRAGAAGAAAKETEKAARQTLDNQLGASKRAALLQSEHESALANRLKETEKAAKDALDSEGKTSRRYQQFEKERIEAEKKLNAEREAEIDKLDKSSLANRARSGLLEVGKWAGPAMMIHGGFDLNFPRVLQGAGLTFAGPTIAKLILSDQTGKVVRGMGRVVAGTPAAAAKAAQINAILSPAKPPQMPE